MHCSPCFEGCCFDTVHASPAGGHLAHKIEKAPSSSVASTDVMDAIAGGQADPLALLEGMPPSENDLQHSTALASCTVHLEGLSNHSLLELPSFP